MLLRGVRACVPAAQRAAVQRRWNTLPVEPLPALPVQLPPYFELRYAPKNTFQRFSSDPAWIMDELTELAQSRQQFYVEDPVKMQFEDSAFNVINYFAVAHGCAVLSTSWKDGFRATMVTQLEPTHMRAQIEGAAAPAPTPAPDAGSPAKTKKKKVLKKGKKKAAASA
eukprot:TRINITY_DN1538_c0_g1_i1.p3 TRINITY_DN1538_c0_g1~~TRINITY_DN1538_c0_g1_i1.p3  ORF type:complete len:168 (+),score=54.77 TRINITY_DN1538_c0_g1_i1:1081-1584(+)